MAEESGYGDWRSLELAIKDAAKKKAQQEGTGISAATVDAQIRQARYDRFLSRVFADGEASEWRRFVYACLDVDHDTQVDTVTVDVVVGPAPVGEPEVIEPANRLHLRRSLVTHPYRLFRWPTRSPTRCAPL